MGHLQGHSVPHDDAREPSADRTSTHFRKAQTSADPRWAIRRAVFSCLSRRPRRCLSSSQRPWCQAKLRIGHGPGPPRAQGRAQVRIPRGNAGLRGRGCTPYKGFVLGFRIVMRRWLNPVLGCRSSCHGAEANMAHSSEVSQDAAHALPLQARAIPVDQGQGS